MKPIVREEFVAKIEAFFTQKPAKSVAHYKFEQSVSADARVYHSTQITAITDLSVELLSPVDFPVDQVIDLNASVFNEIPIKSPLLRVMSSHLESNGSYRVKLIFVEASLDLARRIQTWIAYRGLRQVP